MSNVDVTGGSQTARVSGVSLRLSRHGWRRNDTCLRWRRPGTPPPLKEHAMPPAHINTVAALPLERSDDQGILLQRMAQLNQRLLGPWEDADGQMLPRLTMAEAVAQLYEWGTEYRDHPELARDFAVMAARMARRLPPTGDRSS